MEVPLREVDLRELGTGTQLVLTEALYYGNKVQVAGKVVRLEVENGSVHLHLKPMGTKSEELLKACSGDPHLQLVVHCCPEGCGAVETGDKYIHGLKAMKWIPGRMEEDWMTNLLAVTGPEKGEVDELAALRKRGDALDLDPPGLQEDKKAVASSSSGGKKKRKKKKEKKRKKEKKDKEAEKKRNFSGRHPAPAPWVPKSLSISWVTWLVSREKTFSWSTKLPNKPSTIVSELQYQANCGSGKS